MISNRERVGAMLEALRAGLLPFVEREMKEEYKGQWIRQAAYSIKAGFNESEPHFDSAALLIVMWDNWEPVFKKTLGFTERSILSELRDVRNKYAHEKNFSSDDAYRALDSAERLLNAVSAPQAREVEKARQELRRIQVEEQQRSERRKVAALPIEGATSSSMTPWRDVIMPHPDVAAGYFEEAEFAADLWQVYRGEATSAYQDPTEFFARTYLTEGLRTLLTDALKRLAGKPGGNPVINLMTNFGGGKTHSMLALYHLFSGEIPGKMPGVESLVAQAEAAPPAVAKRAVLVGQKMMPGQPQRKPDGTMVNTLWGELAWQLGGAAGYAMVQRADETGTNPGDALQELLIVSAPSVILIDEWVAYVRQLHDTPGLSGGTFDTQMTFAQTLAEAVKGVPRTLLVVSLPASDIEVGGTRGQMALARLRNIVARVDNPWRPANQEESYEIVRRRLFQSIPQEKVRDRDNVVSRFSRYYRDQPNEFPEATREQAYEERLRSAYPIHPELFDRLYSDWSSLERFQRTRGVLRLMAKVIHELWLRNDASPLIMPAHVPIDSPDVQQELTKYLEDNWVPIIEKDVDGSASIPLEMDRENPNFGRYSASRRVARTVFLGSAPTLTARTPGIDARHVKLGAAQPGEAVSTFGDALRRLSDQAMHLYVDRSRYWYSTRPSVARLAHDRAAQLDKEEVWAELVTRLRTEPRASFGGLHAAPQSSSDVPDDDNVRLVLLGPDYPHTRKGLATHAIQQCGDILRARGTAPRIRQNMLVFLAPDHDQLAHLEAALRSYLAWKSIVDEHVALNLDEFQKNQAQTRLADSNATIKGRVHETYIWILAPTQTNPTDKDSFRWEESRAQGQDALAVRVQSRLINESLLMDRFGGYNLRKAMDEFRLWGDGDHVGTQRLWEYFTRFYYLPRLLSRSVLENAIADGVNKTTLDDFFAFADGFDEVRGHYIALKAGDAITARIDAQSVVVKPEAARAQVEREQERQRALAKPQGTTEAITNAGMGAAETDKTQYAFDVPSVAEIPALPRRYYASVPLNAARPGIDAGRIGEEVLAHLAALPGAQVTVTLEITATMPDGAPENIQRIVIANGQTLRFSSQGFERE